MFNARFPSASVNDCRRSDPRSTQQGVRRYVGADHVSHCSKTSQPPRMSPCMGMHAFGLLCEALTHSLNPLIC